MKVHILHYGQRLAIHGSHCTEEASEYILGSSPRLFAWHCQGTHRNDLLESGLPGSFTPTYSALSVSSFTWRGLKLLPLLLAAECHYLVCRQETWVHSLEISVAGVG